MMDIKVGLRSCAQFKVMPTLIELFAGAGGFRAGCENSIKVVAAIESDPAIATIYADNFCDRNLILSDIRKVNFRHYRGVDFVVGGPPCQDFSMANNQANTASDRALLGLEFLRAIKEARPKAWILENVPMFARSKVWQTIQRECLDYGYTIICGVVNAANYGVPSMRKRFIAIGKTGGVSPVFPAHTHHDPKKGESILGTRKWVSWWESVADIFPQFANLALADFQRKHLSSEALGSVERGENILIPRLGFNPNDGVPWRKSIDPAPTIRAFGLNCDRQWAKFNILGPENCCKLASTRALARWQSFPDSYRLPSLDFLAGQAIGNAIPPLLAKRLISVNN